MIITNQVQKCVVLFDINLFLTYQNDPFFQEEEHNKSKAELTEKNDSVEASLKILDAKLADVEEKKNNLEIKNSLKVKTMPCPFKSLKGF